MYRLELYYPRGGWYTEFLGTSMEILDNLGMHKLRPTGGADRYRVGRARKSDLEALEQGIFQEEEGRMYRRIV